MDGLTDQRGHDRVLLGLLCLLYIIVMLCQIIATPAIVPNATFPFDPIKMELILIVSVGLELLLLLDSVELIIACHKAGFISQFILNGINIACLTVQLILGGQKLIIAFYGIVIVSCFISTLVFMQYQRIMHNVETLHKLAYIDDLTGLPNRKERMNLLQSLTSGPHSIPAFSIAVIDLDNFKMINEALGHQIGDVFLTEIVHNLCNFIKEPNSIGRIGGDEFLIVMKQAQTDAEIETYLSQLTQIVNQPFYYKDHYYKMTTSIGVSRYPKDAKDVTKLLQQVDLALYRAKSRGKNCIVFFDEHMQQNLERQMTLERKLEEAIKNKELYIEYQPQYKIPEKKLRGFEVLVRWDSPTLGHIGPLDFIPLAEENGSIITIGKWILKEACMEFMKVLPEYEICPTLAINFSVVQFRDPDFLSMVKEVIEETGIDTNYLEFEVTEGICINSPEMAKRILTELKNMGIKIALDDFGTGYSSLSYLRTLPLDIVKIDKSFIDPIGKIPDNKNIVKTIIDMAHQLDLEVIAEGIEEDSQLEYLIKNNCDYIQGNLLGRPVPIGAI